MADTCSRHHHDTRVLDVRDVPPRVRHPRIFETFDALAPGAGFVLVNDHDPKPLFSQFTFERPSAFDWQSLEEGPEVWRVEITKRARAAAERFTADQTVGDVARRSPAALEAMKQLGLNHCCGAPLTLSEAAAAAGVTVSEVLDAVNGSTSRGAAT